VRSEGLYQLKIAKISSGIESTNFRNVVNACPSHGKGYKSYFNLLTPNVNYSGRTAPLTSKVAFYIFTQQI